jgi:hypothetical protein
MADTWWLGIRGERSSIDALRFYFPDLQVEPREGHWMVATSRLIPDLGSKEQFRQSLDDFLDLANVLLVMRDPTLTALEVVGPLECESPEGGRGRTLVTKPGNYRVTGHSILLAARGVSGGPTPRPIADRVAELMASSKEFYDASRMLARAGEDFGELWKVMEAIEKAHGGWPDKKTVAKRAQRAALASALQVPELQWEAYHRSGRPDRHYEPHDMSGVTYTAQQVRIGLQHALHVWLDRENPA